MRTLDFWLEYFVLISNFLNDEKNNLSFIDQNRFKNELDLIKEKIRSGYFSKFDSNETIGSIMNK